MYEKQCQSHLYPSQRNHPSSVGAQYGIGEVVIENNQIVFGRRI